MIQTNIRWELTDTFGGEANYSWVRRGVVEAKLGEDYSDLAAVRRVKKAIGWSGLRCKVSRFGDDIELRPHGMAQICFISFHPFGSAS